eukprot:TRINITY_DN16666_c0_g1_i1.p1 TRINITY_DN16666_c0_g1~~TRINITY_DN16666_c0_g1_i1.p1  ORF type:complete len:280 (+),score=42.36 TRINITY_DN16666_c0_g1_i1:59-898(+)
MTEVPDIEDIGFNRPCTAPLGATVKPYDHHLFICAGPETHNLWPQKDTHSSLLKDIKNRLKDIPDKKVKVSYCDFERPGVVGWELLYFEKDKRYPVFIKNLTRDNPNDIKKFFSTGELGALTLEEFKHDYFIFVCSHELKDKRCGYCGPIIQQQLQERIEAEKIDAIVLKTSHIGGHKYAANVIVYPTGDWYGYVKPKDVDRIVKEHLIGKKVCYDLWRGRRGLTITEQAMISPSKNLTKELQEKVKRSPFASRYIVGVVIGVAVVGVLSLAYFRFSKR